MNGPADEENTTHNNFFNILLVMPAFNFFFYQVKVKLNSNLKLYVKFVCT